MQDPTPLDPRIKHVLTCKFHMKEEGQSNTQDGAQLGPYNAMPSIIASNILFYDENLMTTM